MLAVVILPDATSETSKVALLAALTEHELSLLCTRILARAWREADRTKRALVEAYGSEAFEEDLMPDPAPARRVWRLQYLLTAEGQAATSLWWYSGVYAA